MRRIVSIFAVIIAIIFVQACEESTGVSYLDTINEVTANPVEFQIVSAVDTLSGSTKYQGENVLILRFKPVIDGETTSYTRAMEVREWPGKVPESMINFAGSAKIAMTYKYLGMVKVKEFDKDTKKFKDDHRQVIDLISFIVVE